MTILILLTLTFIFQPKLIVYLYCNKINHVIVLIRCVVHQDVTLLRKKRWELIFIKGAKCFKAKKAINHQLEAHGYGGDQEEDEEGDDGVCGV